MTSRPTRGRTPRFGQELGDRTSDAVRSGCRGSLGAIAMRARGSPESNCTFGSTVCHSPPREVRMNHTVFPQVTQWHIYHDSRTGYKENKISVCIAEA